MRHLRAYFLAALLLVSQSANAATVTGNLLLVTGDASASQKIEFEPMDAPFQSGVNTILPRTARTTSGTDGDFTINILQGAYRLKVNNQTIGVIRVPAGSGTYNIAALNPTFSAYTDSVGSGSITNVALLSASSALSVSGSPLTNGGGTITLDIDQTQLDLSQMTGIIEPAHLPLNSASAAGAVDSASGQTNKVWGTDGSGVAGWQSANIGTFTPGFVPRAIGTNSQSDSIIEQTATNAVVVHGSISSTGDTTQTNYIGGAGNEFTNYISTATYLKLSGETNRLTVAGGQLKLDGSAITGGGGGVAGTTVNTTTTAAGNIAAYSDATKTNLTVATSANVQAALGSIYQATNVVPASLSGAVINSGTPVTTAVPTYSGTTGTNITPSSVTIDSLTNLTVPGQVTITAGSVSSSTPVVNATETWNSAGTTFTGLKLNITNTASAAASLLMDLQVGGTSKFSVDKSGNIISPGNFGLGSAAVGVRFLAGNTANVYISRATGANNPIVTFYDSGTVPSVWLAAATQLAWENGSSTMDTILVRDAANTLALRNGVNSQTLNIYNTYTDASNYERLSINALSGNYRFMSQQAGTGSAKSFQFNAGTYSFQSSGGSQWWNINSSGHLLAGTDNTYDIGASGSAVRSITLGRTITTPGTTGTQTINKSTGRVNFAIAATSLVVTNSLVTANSIVIAIPASADSTGRVNSVVPAAGQFTINATGPAAEMPVNFMLVSP